MKFTKRNTLIKIYLIVNKCFDTIFFNKRRTTLIYFFTFKKNFMQIDFNSEIS